MSKADVHGGSTSMSFIKYANLTMSASADGCESLD